MQELKCQNCGGRLEFEDEDVRVGDGWVMWRNRDKVLTCASCGTQFVRGDDLMADKGTLESGNIIVGNISNSSGVVIGGGSVFIGGDIIDGNKAVHYG